jgi:hypothetical protein
MKSVGWCWMVGYRLYYLDKLSHIVGREEFFAEDDNAALMVAASLHRTSERVHAGLMLWAGARQVFATDENSDRLVVFSIPAGALA